MTTTTDASRSGPCRGRLLSPYKQAAAMLARLIEFCPDASHAILGKVRSYDATDLLRLPVLLGRPGEAPDLVWFSLGRTARATAENGGALAPGFVAWQDVLEVVVELSGLLADRLGPAAVQNPMDDAALLAAVRRWWPDSRPARVSPAPPPSRGLH